MPAPGATAPITAVNVTAWPRTLALADELRDVRVSALPIVSLNAPTLPENRPSLLRYVAVTPYGLIAAFSMSARLTALPLASSATGAPRFTPSTANCTVPVGIALGGK